MANIYQVSTSDGKVHTVTTDHHHDNHSIEQFKAILKTILQNSAGGVISGTILHFVFKGRK